MNSPNVQVNGIIVDLVDSSDCSSDEKELLDQSVHNMSTNTTEASQQQQQLPIQTDVHNVLQLHSNEELFPVKQEQFKFEVKQEVYTITSSEIIDLSNDTSDNTSRDECMDTADIAFNGANELSTKEVDSNICSSSLRHQIQKNRSKKLRTTMRRRLPIDIETNTNACLSSPVTKRKHRQLSSSPTVLIESRGLRNVRNQVPNLSFSEIQAQEREYARYMNKKRRLNKTNRKKNALPQSMSPNVDESTASVNSMLRVRSTCPPDPSVLPTEKAADTSKTIICAKTVENRSLDAGQNKARFRHSTAWRQIKAYKSSSHILSHLLLTFVPYSDIEYKPLEKYLVSSNLLSTLPGNLAEYVEQETLNSQVDEFATNELSKVIVAHEFRVREYIKQTRNQIHLYRAAKKMMKEKLLINGGNDGPIFSHVLKTSFDRQCEFPMVTSLLSNDHLEKCCSHSHNIHPTPIMFNLGLPISECTEEVEVVAGVVPKYGVNFLGMTSQIPTLPKSSCYVSLNCNPLQKDEPNLSHIPFIEQGENISLDSRLFNLNDRELCNVENQPSLEIQASVDTFSQSYPISSVHNKLWQMDAEIKEIIVRLIFNQFGENEAVYTAIENLSFGLNLKLDKLEDLKKKSTICNDDTEANTHISESTVISDCEEQNNAERCKTDIASLEISSDPLQFATSPSFKANDAEITNITVDINKHDKLGMNKSSSYPELMQRYTKFFCPVCYQYNCQIHGIACTLPCTRNDPIYPPTRDSAQVQSVLSYSYIDTDSDESLDSDDNIDTDGEEDDHEDELNIISNGNTSNHHRRRSNRKQTQVSSIATDNLHCQQNQMVRHEKTGQTSSFSSQSDMNCSFVCRSDPLMNSIISFLDPTSGEKIMEHLNVIFSDRGDCGLHCWKNTGQESSAQVVRRPNRINSTERLLVKKLADIVGDSPCAIAAILCSSTCPCSSVWTYLQLDLVQDKPSAVNLDNHNQAETPVRDEQVQSIQNGVKSLYSRSQQRKYKKAINKRRDKDYENLLIRLANPENHYVPCTTNCPCRNGNLNNEHCECFKRGYYCEKYCGCPKTCSNRFSGCQCKRGCKIESSCACVLANRECNPDTCIRCCAGTLVYEDFNNLVNAKKSMGDFSELSFCKNLNLSRDLKKKIAISKSTTHGYGAFAMVDIKKGDFIYEYRGETITSDEAERRGSLYDHQNSVYLFSITMDRVIDADRKGNKARFINHDGNASANCEPRILNVKGERRVALFAKRSIMSGEELFYDYGYDQEHAPLWAQYSPRT